MPQHAGMVATLIEVRQRTALHHGGSRTQSEAKFRQAGGCRTTVEAAAMQDQRPDAGGHGNQALGLAEQEAAAATMTTTRITQHLSSLNPVTVVALQQGDDLGRVDNASSESDAIVADLEESQSLLALTKETDLGSRHDSKIDYLSPLQLWVYQNSSDNMTLAERLEKSQWETPRLERL